MNQSLLSLVATVAAEVAAVIVIRALPFSLWALVSRRVRLPEKVMALLLYASLVVLAQSRDRLFVGALITVVEGLLYFAAAAGILAYLTTRHYLRRAPRFGILLLCSAAFFAVPGLCFRGPAGTALLMAGWELTFASYSYAVEGGARTGSLRDALFFLLVNPVLCYPERGGWSHDTTTLRASWGRAAGGALLVAAGVTTLALVALPSMRAAGVDALGYGQFVASQGRSIVRTYFIHAGVAHLQLGLLAGAGYRAPNRYVRPWLASGPADFWRRWNAYVGSWFRRYVFLPLSLALARRLRLRAELRTSIAVLLTFAAAGLAHDVVWLISTGPLGAGVVAFCFQGVVVLGFEFARRSAAAAYAAKPVLGIVERVGFWHTLMVMAWLLKPASG
ncbi:MAG TPA: MBOAT family O-acyltransferase [Polyangiales bacterium]